ncbi:NADPH:quinone oxidoreductase family protein [Reyranella sp. CPCC 100927]|uniref:NADPH:quinone oxidoreductase family protein n=1 Tax=Reyranella sp. CPCC 100927 TaxID=2599616 RepID=UPI0011B458CF|nr:NADPH:quinone oxidoreductase family protein [Reyranella sp. CPCC 100927]TWT08822.1 NADPH:quinone oxidoreductase family protein [Reyranella sp. CPCC 100927]
MRALVCHEYGSIEALKIEDVPPPPLKPGHVRVAVHAGGVSFAALLGVQGKHQNKPPLPYIPGNEMAGIVLEAAPDVTGFAPGDRVTGPVASGGFGAEVVSPAANLYRIPEALGFAAATSFPTLYPTAYGALRWKAKMAPGETLLVHGAGGGSGLTAVEVGKAMGATVIATAGGADKLEVARQHGADHLIDSRREDIRARVLDITSGHGADVIYDPVGGEIFDQSLRCVAVEGRIIPMGFASGKVPQIPANILLVKNVTVIGFYYGYYNGWGRPGETVDPLDLERRRKLVQDALAEMFGWFEQGKLTPRVAGHFPLADWVQAFRLIEDRKVVGKAALDPTR